ncbi:MAG TPA: D-2-hydroxyacid dehydrogenase [Candidatus Limnocylindrales bacterium]|nr:D-2-hydroxyacid dehydrogenase [Candidatus Limnocylindrales bacterium]
MTRIAVWGTFGGAANDLPQLLTDDEVIVIKDEAELARAAEAEVFFGTNAGARARSLLAAAPKLRWYQSAGAGVENLVTIPDFRERRILLTNNSGAMDIPIAEHVIAMILAAAKRLHLYRDQQARKEWKDHRQGEIRGSTLVVFGLGSIGAEAARLGAALGMKVIGVRRRDTPVAGVERIVPPEQLADVAADADYLAVCAPLTNATRGAISRDVLARMKPTAWVVNIARGAIVDEAALIEALRAERIGGAALDAHAVEPLPADNPLWSLPNVLITPHSSNSSPNVRPRTIATFRENLRRYKAGEPLLNLVDLEAGY